MKANELKLRVNRFASNLIDMCVPPTDFLSKVSNATAKFWVDQNISKIDKYLDFFSDENGMIDEKGFINHLEKVLFVDDKLQIDLEKVLPESMSNIAKFIPSKTIVIDKSDIYDLLQ